MSRKNQGNIQSNIIDNKKTIYNHNSKSNINGEVKIYSAENVKYRIQKRIGYIFSIFLIILIIINLFNELVIFGKPQSGLAIFYKIFMLIEAILFYWSTKKGKVKLKRFFQFFFILANGILTLFSDINNVYFGISFLIFGSLLMLQYDLFEHRYINYIIFGLLLFVCAVFIYNFYFQLEPNSGGYTSLIEDSGKLHIYKIINIIMRVIFIALFLILFPSIYIDQANFYKNLNDLVIKEKESLASFANIGMMLNNTVHNFNNKIVTFLSSEYIITSTLQKYQKVIDPKDYEKMINTCQMVKHSSDEMTLMIKDIKNLIKEKTNQQLQTYEINKIVEDIIKQFKIGYEKRQITFDFEKESEVIFVKGNSIQFIQILENLIKNSIDAAENPQIIIKTGDGPSPYITIKDNGHGIPFCFKCKSKNCLNCKEFQIGKTTKEEGSGTGMVYVQNTLKQMNANLSIESSPDGTSVTIKLPDSATQQLERIEQIYLDKQNIEREAFKGV